MTDGPKKGDQKKRISDKERFNYIGFEVHPGTPKDLFKSEAEKAKLIEGVIAKRNKGDILRDQCILLEERVSPLDRIVLTLASVVIVASLFIPWYSVYNVIIEEKNGSAPVALADSLTIDGGNVEADSLTIDVGNVEADSAGILAGVEGTETTATEVTGSTVAGGEPLAQTTDTAVTADEGESRFSAITGDDNEEIITGYIAKKSIIKEYARLSGLGALVSIGSLGGYVFSSGFILMLTGVIMILYTLLCLALPAYTIYGIYGTKGDEDTKALALKQILKYNWLPVALLVLAMFLSFVGADYGFDGPALFTSIGDSYGTGAFLGSMSYGVIVTICSFVLLAAKGSEI